MCIHIFARRHNLTVRFLHEQIWVAPEHANYAIDEVYDVVVRNDDTSSIDNLFVYCPYYLYESSPTATIVAADPLSITPDAPDSRFNWYFTQQPAWLDRDRRTVSLSVRVSGQEAQLQGLNECELLTVHPFIPADLTADEHFFPVMQEIDRSLFGLRLDVPLRPQKTGVFRLKLRPAVLNQQLRDAIVTNPDPANTYPHRFTADYEVFSSDIIIRDTVRALATKTQALDEKSRAHYDGVRSLLRQYVRNARADGGSTRIEHQIISLASDAKELLIEPVGEMSGISYLGVTTAVWTEGRRREKRRALMCYCGPDDNSRDDLVLNVVRVLNQLAVKTGGMSPKELVDMFSDGRVEAFHLLLNNMRAVGLLKENPDNPRLVCWGFDTGEHEDFTKHEAYITGIKNLRHRYDNPEDYADAPAQRSLYDKYKNMHSSRIGFRFEWDCYHPENKNLAAEAARVSQTALQQVSEAQTEIAAIRTQVNEIRKDVTAIDSDGKVNKKMTWVSLAIGFVGLILAALGLIPLLLQFFQAE